MILQTKRLLTDDCLNVLVRFARKLGYLHTIYILCVCINKKKREQLPTVVLYHIVLSVELFLFFSYSKKNFMWKRVIKSKYNMHGKCDQICEEKTIPSYIHKFGDSTHDRVCVTSVVFHYISALFCVNNVIEKRSCTGSYGGVLRFTI